jgi:hypothetical protein
MPKKTRFRFKPFQLEDIARAALVDRAILSWEPGLGKTLAGIAWALIKDARRVLLVVPGQLHRDFRNEAHEKFGIHLTSLTHRSQLKGFGLTKPLADVGRPRFFLCTYHDLGFNHTSHGAQPMANHLGALIKAGAGVDCVVVDEGTRLQADETHIAEGVRKLDPTLRLLLTATPNKNRLESFFYLAAWVGGDLWPYPSTPSARRKFAADHLTAVRANGSTERTARITNLHHFWYLTAPFMIRRRKIETGEAIPPKIVKPIVLQPGTQQAQVYQTHLYHPPLLSSKGRPLKGFGRVAVQLNYLRQAALAPHSPSLGRVQSDGKGPKKSSTDFNPKLVTCLSLIARLLQKREQVIVGSPFRAFNHSLHSRLLEAGVSSLLLDGKINPYARGELAAQFYNGRHSVSVVGLAAMSEGFNFDNCYHLILPSFSWAFDENEQFVNRIWRITSRKAVHIYPLSIAGTIDQRLTELYYEKTATSQLAFDHRLIDEYQEDVDLSDLLRHSIKAFKPGAATLDETAMEAQWTARLRNRLTRAEARYRTKHPLPNSVKQISFLPPTTPENPNSNSPIENSGKVRRRKQVRSRRRGEQSASARTTSRDLRAAFLVPFRSHHAPRIQPLPPLVSRSPGAHTRPSHPANSSSCPMICQSPCIPCWNSASRSRQPACSKSIAVSAAPCLAATCRSPGPPG